MPRLSPSERFWEKVDTSGDCWIWTSSIKRDGYGLFWSGERQVYAHRWVYEELVGPIPEGLTIDHLCRNRACVKPAHLEPVTMGENIRRGNPRFKQLAARTRCRRGHLYDASNTYRHPAIGRRCRACDAERTRARRRARREAAA